MTDPIPWAARVNPASAQRRPRWREDESQPGPGGLATGDYVTHRQRCQVDRRTVAKPGAPSEGSTARVSRAGEERRGFQNHGAYYQSQYDPSEEVKRVPGPPPPEAVPATR
jgi:hypothetical protein